MVYEDISNRTVRQRAFLTKPIEVIKAEECSEELPRQLRLFDLLCIGIGGTVGTGIFATAGEIIHDVAGPSAALSWVFAGIACCISGIAYMELTARIPSSGSCYAYSYFALGELPAVIAAFLLTMEYAVSGAGVARSWAGKVQSFANDVAGTEDGFQYLNEEYYNLMGFLVQAAAVAILLAGLRFGKIFINSITVTKVLLVLFMIVAGFSAMDSDNLDPFVPPRNDTANFGGPQGIMLGASKAFFGYVGFDEVCCLAAEAQNPRKTMPRAVLGVVVGTCILSAFASLALASLQSFEQIDDGFAGAFGSADLEWAKWIVRVGETFTMPVVVLVAFLAQPRLQYAMAIDGLFPSIFKKVDAQGNIFWNTLITGVVFSIVAFLVPFESLWSLVDFGVLLSFNITNACLIMVRTRTDSPVLAPKLVATLFFSTGIAVLILQKGYLEDHDSIVALVFSIIFFIIAFASMVAIFVKCPQQYPNEKYFSAPLVPFLPALAMVMNWYLLSQIDMTMLLVGLLYIGLAVLFYFAYGYHYSVGNTTNWKELLECTSDVPRLSVNDVHPSPGWMFTDDNKRKTTSVINLEGVVREEENGSGLKSEPVPYFSAASPGHVLKA